ncbi:uncharacterized protein LOC128233650 isoform X1 [Mya arenaria]|uniref:uncharacterized protein LOC128233650 isoform X1 n=2 Tax=Mya arenaria TaxID=6604 RepID=UPI0022E7AA59|nr:uncharacterized protein LOC128233650 isoform X1 [Mya arenaria]
MRTFMCLCFLTLLKTYAAQIHMSANVFVNENDSVPVTCNTTEPAFIVEFYISNLKYATIFPKSDCKVLYANVTCICESITVITCMTLILKRNDHGNNVTFLAQYGSRSVISSVVIHVIDMNQSNSNVSQEHARYEDLNMLRCTPNGEYTDLGFNTKDNIKERTSSSENNQYENLTLNSTKRNEQELALYTIDV